MWYLFRDPRDNDPGLYIQGRPVLPKNFTREKLEDIRARYGDTQFHKGYLAVWLDNPRHLVLLLCELGDFKYTGTTDFLI